MTTTVILDGIVPSLLEEEEDEKEKKINIEGGLTLVNIHFNLLTFDNRPPLVIRKQMSDW